MRNCSSRKEMRGVKSKANSRASANKTSATRKRAGFKTEQTSGNSKK